VISCLSFGPLANLLPNAVTKALYRSAALARAAGAAGSGSAGVVAGQKRTKMASVSTEIPRSRSSRVIRRSIWSRRLVIDASRCSSASGDRKEAMAPQEVDCAFGILVGSLTEIECFGQGVWPSTHRYRSLFVCHACLHRKKAASATMRSSCRLIEAAPLRERHAILRSGGGRVCCEFGSPCRQRALPEACFPSSAFRPHCPRSSPGDR
jgi:hypothetical protein